MKKLIPMMAVAAVAFGAFADKAPIKSQGFEAVTEGAVEDLDALTKSDADLVWSTTDKDATLTVAAYDTTKETPYTYGEQDKYFGDTNNKNLSIESSAPIYAGYGAAMDILADGTYIDTLVKFTVTEKDTDVTADTNAKLAIWAQATDEEGTANVLKVMCGEIADGALTTVTYNLSKEGIDPEKWYRLTVRTADSGEKVDDAAVAEFTIYLDGVKLTAGEQEKFLACVTGSTIEGVGFKGNGAVDDVAITDNENAPSFAIPPLVDIDIKWDTDQITALTVNGVEVKDVAAGTMKATPDKDGNVAVTDITFADGWMGAAEQTLTAENPAVVAQKVAVTDGEGNKYASIADALEAGAKSIKLAADLSDETTSMYAIENDVIFDLAGFAYEVPNADYNVFSITEGATLTVISSVAGGSITADAEGGIFDDQGNVVIGATIVEGVATLDAGLVINGYVTENGSNTVVYNGKFLASANEDFAETVTIASGYEAVEDGDYIVVKAKEGPEPKPTYTVTVNAATGVTVTGAPTEKVEAGDVTLTVTANEGYKNVVVKVGEETITGVEDVYTIAVAADTTVDITVTQITYATVTITSVENCTITVADADGEAVATGTKFDVDDEVVLTVTRTPATGYELDGCAAEETVTMDEDKTITAAVKSAGGTVRPVVINGGSTDQIAAYDTWAAEYGVTGEETAELADAFAINAAPADAADALAAIITADMVAEKIVAIDLTADGAYFKLADYPNAKFKFVKVDDIDTDANLFKLQAEFDPAN